MIWKTETHHFTATICQHTGKTCPALARVARALVQSVSAAGAATSPEFEIEGSAELAHCATGCTARFRAQSDEAHIYCGVAPSADIEQLESYAEMMFGTEISAMPSGSLATPPCAMLQVLPVAPKASATAELRASA